LNVTRDNDLQSIAKISDHFRVRGIQNEIWLGNKMQIFWENQH
jgi:hypothetical protein